MRYFVYRVYSIELAGVFLPWLKDYNKNTKKDNNNCPFYHLSPMHSPIIIIIIIKRLVMLLLRLPIAFAIAAVILNLL